MTYDTPMKIVTIATALLITFIGLTTAAKPAPSSQELTESNYRDWLKYIRPSDSEDGWRKISWRNNLMPAVAEAKKLDRPILLWAMNGNPCGET